AVWNGFGNESSVMTVRSLLNALPAADEDFISAPESRQPARARAKSTGVMIRLSDLPGICSFSVCFLLRVVFEVLISSGQLTNHCIDILVTAPRKVDQNDLVA